ncbi:protein AF-9 [Venturia canescens]|uniref:protein AF-9 n=1 Tax=Venturia canescens TaxID=32260 RepID=UPI001C9C67F0|nr:protein AF-9 [Venturia canescens]
MAIRVTLECGHASMLRVRTTPQGYTHDWEVFVRGIDNADISQYVDKVVFHLHETFPKPKRILKEPPYVVKESGYAGFVIPIDVYLKNKDEPRRIQISYDLILLPSGPAFNNVIRHHEVFANPSEEFRKKLLKGGGVTVSNSEDPVEKGDLKMVPPMVSKPKLSGTEVKKHRTTDLRTSNSFADLFGNPMTLPAKVSPESKRAQSEKLVVSKGAVPEKVEKFEKSTKAKHSPHKDKKKDKSVEGEKKEKKDKGSSKEKERGKEKSKRAPSPGGNKEELYATGKKGSPQSPTKKALLVPLPVPSQKSPSPKPKEKEHKKTHPDKEKDRLKDNFKMPIEERKLDRKKKKHKEEKSKERKEREKDHEKTKDSSKKSERKILKPEKHEGAEKEKSVERKVGKEEKKSPKHQKDKDKVRSEKSDRIETGDKPRDVRTDKDKQKHKHKKKEKKDRNEESSEKEKSDKLKLTNDKKSSSYSNASPTPDAHSGSLIDRGDSSDSAHSLDEDPLPTTKPFNDPKNEPETLLPISDSSKALSSPCGTTDSKPEIDEGSKREKTKNARSEERKRKRKLEAGQQDEHSSKRSKDREHSISPSVEPVSSSQSPISSDLDTRYNFKDTAAPLTQAQDNDSTETEQVAPDSTNNAFIEPEPDSHPAQQVFSDDYVTQLKELQQKIMTLQDNQELQRVVQVIAETGQYEITKKTFDFDLCALDRRTVLRLQQFFSTS